MKPRKIFFALVALASFNTAYAEGEGRLPPESNNRYGRTEAFSVDYKLGRTYRKAYEQDPHAAATPPDSSTLARTCFISKPFDFDTRGLAVELSRSLLEDKRYSPFEVITVVSIPLQKMFVLSRSVYKSSRDGNGLIYAWKTSTGYHDKHFAMSRREGQLVHGQKGSVMITHKDKADALRTLGEHGKKKGARLSADGLEVIFDGTTDLDETGRPKFPGKRVRYSETVSKMREDRARASGLEIAGEAPDLPGFLLVRKHSLNYEDWYHTQPGYYVIQNGFSSRHMSSESDGNYEIEHPTMPWAVFFNLNRGMATHGAAYRGTMGSPNSHGCVRLLEENACRLFHLVGHSGRGSVPAINEKTGEPLSKNIEGYRSLFLVTDKLGEIEKKYLNQL
jgi:hypothetical protein